MASSGFPEIKDGDDELGATLKDRLQKFIDFFTYSRVKVTDYESAKMLSPKW